MADDILVHIDVDSSEALAATSAYGKALDRLDAQLTRSAAAQMRLDAAIAKSGAGSDAAVAAQAKYDAALKRTSAAQDQVAIASARSAEVQQRAYAASQAAATRAAAAQEALAAKQAAALKRVGTVAGGIGAAAAVGLGLAAKAAADFDSKMAQITALLPASEKSMTGALASAAHGFVNLGFSASDAADAETELIKAGISVKDILGGALTGTVNLAAAGQLDLGTATSIAAQAMTQFQLQGKDIPHVADLLAAGADRALGSVQDLGEGLQYAGLSAHQAGLSIDETVGVLSEFAQAGLIGSQGGTTLQQVLRQLLSPTKKAADEIKTLGLNLYDSQGNFVGLASVAGQLHDKLGSMDQAQRNAALGAIFTSRAIRGASILYQDGAKGVEFWQKRVEAAGFAADQARGKMDSLSGDLQKLGAVVQNDLIDVGQQLQPVLRGITHDLETVGNVIGGLPDPVKAVGVQFGVAVAALGLGFFAFTRIKGAAVSLAEALGVLAKAQEGVAATAGTMAAGEDVAAAAMTREAGAAKVGLLGGVNKAALGRLGVGLGAVLGASILDQFSHGKSGASTFAGIGSDALYGAALGSFIPGLGTLAGAGIGAGAGALYGAFTHPQVRTDTRPGYGYSTAGDFSGGGPVAPDPRFTGSTQVGMAALQQNPITVSAAQSTKVLAELGVTGQKTYAEIAASAGQAVGPVTQVGQAALSGMAGVKKFGTALNGLLSPNLNLSAATDAWVSGLHSLSDSLSKNTKSLQGNTAGALQNRDAIRTQVTNMEGVLKAQADAGASAHQLSSHLVEMRQRLIDAGEAAGISKDQMTKYLAVVGLTPHLVSTIVKNNAPQAEQDIWSYRHAIDGVPGFKDTVITAKTQHAEEAMLRLIGLEGEIRDKSVFISVTTQYTHSGVQATPASGGLIDHGRLRRFADGGMARYYQGPGTGTSDSIPAMVSNGEFVNKASVVAREGVSKFFALNAGRATIVPRYTAGGYVGAARGSGVDQALVGAVNAMAKEIATLRARLDRPITTDVRRMPDISGQVAGVAQDEYRQNGYFEAGVAGMAR